MRYNFILKRISRFSTFSRHFENREFFKNHESSGSIKIASVVGEIIDNAVDLKNVRPGESIEVPYEVTVSHSMRDFWQSAFYSHDRINTSTPFARQLNLQDQVIPFGLMLFLAGSMSHADQAKLQTGYTNAKYLWPGFAGDTFKKKFIIRSLRSTSDGNNSIVKINCEIRNQRNVVVFTCEKTMLFPFKVPPSEVEVEPNDKSMSNDFLNHLIQQAETLQGIGSQTLTSLRPGQLIVHTLTRPISETHTMQLACLARLTHERHFNTRKFRR
jgi:acyl dehydratase